MTELGMERMPVMGAGMRTGVRAGIDGPAYEVTR
jgi:hypothetical protein